MRSSVSAKTKGRRSHAESRHASMTLILDCAEAEFAEKGYNGATLTSVAELARVDTSLMRYYFGDKERLFEAVFMRRAPASNRFDTDKSTVVFDSPARSSDAAVPGIDGSRQGLESEMGMSCRAMTVSTGRSRERMTVSRSRLTVSPSSLRSALAFRSNHTPGPVGSPAYLLTRSPRRLTAVQGHTDAGRR